MAPRKVTPLTNYKLIYYKYKFKDLLLFCFDYEHGETTLLSEQIRTKDCFSNNLWEDDLSSIEDYLHLL